MLKQVETNFKDSKNRQVQAEVEMVKKGLKEGISRSNLDPSVIIHRSAKSFKKRGE
jgi:hypothetical protein